MFCLHGCSTARAYIKLIFESLTQDMTDSGERFSDNSSACSPASEGSNTVSDCGVVRANFLLGLAMSNY